MFEVRNSPVRSSASPRSPMTSTKVAASATTAPMAVATLAEMVILGTAPSTNLPR